LYHLGDSRGTGCSSEVALVLVVRSRNCGGDADRAEPSLCRRYPRRSFCRLGHRRDGGEVVRARDSLNRETRIEDAVVDGTSSALLAADGEDGAAVLDDVIPDRTRPQDADGEVEGGG